MEGTIKHNDTVAFGFYAETEQNTARARNKQEARQTFFIEHPHDDHSFIFGLALVSYIKERAKAVPAFEYLVNSIAYGCCTGTVC